MNNNNLSIATITWARDEVEENLLRQSLQKLAALDISVFITDGGSNTGFLDFLSGFPHFKLFQVKTKGLWAQAKNSLHQACRSGSEFILYTEPDKYDFFSRLLPQMLNEVRVNSQSGILMASRSTAGFKTFPPFQRMTETTINNCCAEVIGKSLDYTYGPFLLNRKLVPYLDLVQEEIGWGWRPYTFVMASRLGYSVEAYVADFSCPPEQQVDDPKERIYRMRQLEQNMQGIVLSASIKLPD
jgi:hypothetical protein